MLYTPKYKSGTPLKRTIPVYTGGHYIKEDGNTCKDYLTEVKIKKRITKYYESMKVENESIDDFYEKIDKVYDSMPHISNTTLEVFSKLSDEEMISHILFYRIRPKD
jgi:hypothetical protein